MSRQMNSINRQMFNNNNEDLPDNYQQRPPVLAAEATNHQQLFAASAAQYPESMAATNMSGYSPYKSTFPDFRQDSRPTFNVDFR